MMRTNCYLTEPQVKRLEMISKRTGFSESELIRSIIENGLRKYEEEIRVGNWVS